MSYRSPGLFALLLAIGVLTAPAHAETPAEVKISPAPAWADIAPIESLKSSVDADGGRYDLLYDRQFRITESSQRFSRNVYQLSSSSGVEDHSQISLEFDPTYQTLEMHWVRLWRDGKVIDVLQPHEIKLLQRESELEARIFDGSLTAVFILKDVRAGDTVDYAYSISGENPVFDSKVSAGCPMGWTVPIERVRCRLLWPAARPLNVTERGVPAAVVHEQNGVREYVWERTKVAPLPHEDETPSWYDPYAWVEWSEFQSWEAVARWSLSHQPSSIDPSVVERVKQWQALPTEEVRFLAALRFVQDEVRYLGVEMGASSHQPHRPEDVLKHRFGDCKDKSLLLVSLLRAMNIEAAPVVVNTRVQQELEKRPPSPLSFDHEIVRAVVEGKPYWVDATASYERGSLAQQRMLPFSWGLVIAAGTKGLTPIPYDPPKTPLVEVDETYAFESVSQPSTLQVVTTYHGREANRMRARWARQSKRDLEKQFLNYYARAFPSIEVAAPLALEDEVETNTVRLKESYTIQNALADRPELPLTGFQDILTRPRVRVRKTPLAIPYPEYVTQTIHVRMPERGEVEEDNGKIEDDALRFTYNVSGSGRDLTMKYSLQTLVDAVPPEKSAAHLEVISNIWKHAGGSIPFRAFGTDGAQPLDPKETLAVVVLIAVVAGGFAVRAWWRGRAARKRKRGFQSRQRQDHGETAATAIRVRTDTNLVDEVAKLSCPACNTKYGAQELELEEAKLGDTPLTIARVQCPTCSTRRPVYFIVRTLAIVH